MSFITGSSSFQSISATPLSSVLSAGTKYSSKILNTIGVISSKFIAFYTLYNVFESALSDLLCLKTFRHGSDPYACLNIRLSGPDNNLSGKGSGGEAAWYNLALEQESPYASSDEHCFFVVEDTIDKNFSFVEYIASKRTVKYYTLRSTAAFWGSFLPMPKRWKARITRAAVSAIDYSCSTLGSDYFLMEIPKMLLAFSALICPTVKFHIDPDEVIMVDSRKNLDPKTLSFCRDGEDSYPDKDFSGALVTEYQFSRFDMGLVGILKNGFNTNLPARIYQNPKQFLWGTAQLVLAIALTILLIPAAPYHNACKFMTNYLDNKMDGGGERLNMMLKALVGLHVFSQF